jgi:hypothetical protein
MKAPATITIRNAKFTLAKSFGVTAATVNGCLEQAEYIGQRGRSVFVQFFSNGTARAINGGTVQTVII